MEMSTVIRIRNGDGGEIEYWVPRSKLSVDQRQCLNDGWVEPSDLAKWKSYTSRRTWADSATVDHIYTIHVQ